MKCNSRWGGAIARALIPIAVGIGLTATLTACGGGGGGPEQGITRIVINDAASQNVTFEGKSFGSVGTYRKIRGTAFGQLNPNDSKNRVIADMTLAERNAQGMVEYSMDFYILTPTDPSKGNKKVFYEANNRGGKLFGGFNQSSGGNNPTTAADAANGFLFTQGYTLAWSGWDIGATPGATADTLTIKVPLAKNPDGSSITGPSYEYFVTNNATTTSFLANYAPDSRDTTKATLTQRQYLTDTPQVVPSTQWTWTATSSIALAGNAPFRQGWIYELTFTAKDPLVAGIGMAAMRDFNAFLRYETKALDGSANPLAGNVNRILVWSLSQPARLLNDYIWLGFNQDTKGRKVLDGVFNWIGGGNGLGINYRFAQTGRTERNRQNHLNTEAPFPFAYTKTTDPLTGKTDGRSERCLATGTCPLVMNIFSGNEAWVKAGSLLHTDPATGRDIAEPAHVRNYYVSGSQHGGASAPNTNATAVSFNSCQQFGSGVEPNPLLRALWVALDQWADGVAPPPSATASVDKGTAVFVKTGAFSPIGIGAVPQADLGWPTIPKVLYSGLVTVRNLWDLGPRFNDGILDIYPPKPTGRYYPVSVPKVDADGNDIAGIRLPEVVAPVATNSGWGLRHADFGGKADGTDGCESTGQSVVFAPTRAAREAAGDPRPSLEERYTNRAGLVAARTAAANALKAQRLLLQADVDAYISNAANEISVVASPTYGSYKW